MPYKKGDEPVPGFKLVRLLGRGGFGEVWKATAPGGVLAAIKIINLSNDQGYKEFRAIRLIKHINHPNLVHTIGFWLKDEDGKVFSEELSGETLSGGNQAAELLIAMGLGDKNLFDRLKECQQEGKPGIPHEELLDYMEAAAKALDFLNHSKHDFGTGAVAIQHCDIKPQNILIVGGSAQVCDFGLARVLGDAHHTQIGGTAFYTAPEVLNSNEPSKTTDQYSLAISYFHLLTGMLPFDSRVPTGAMIAHLGGKLDFSRLAEAEHAVLKRATSLDPTKRYPTSLEMVRELRRAFEQSRTAVRKSDEPVELCVEVGSELVPGYKIVRRLGGGGYGEVFEASAPGGKHVALKVIKNLECPKGLQEFKSLEVIKGVEHNHLIELHAYWILDRYGQVIPDEMRDRADAPAPSTLVIASRLANKSLLDRLKECRKDGFPGIPLQELVHYMIQVASAIDHLNCAQHPMGENLIAIQHRDIKPENILLSRDNTIKLADFGLAKVLEGAQAIIHGTSAGLTPAYAAPEMILGTVTSWTDQYSLGITYHHLRIGSLPFEKNLPINELIQIHLQGRLNLSQLPDPEREVISRATRVKPEERYPDCTTMVKALQKSCNLTSNYELSLPSQAYTRELDLGTGSSPPGSTSRSGPRPSDKPKTHPTPIIPHVPTAPVPSTPMLPESTSALAEAPLTHAYDAAGLSKTSPPVKPQHETESEYAGHTRTTPPSTGSTAQPPIPPPEVMKRPPSDHAVKPGTLNSISMLTDLPSTESPAARDERSAPAKAASGQRRAWAEPKASRRAGPSYSAQLTELLKQSGFRRLAILTVGFSVVLFVLWGGWQVAQVHVKSQVKSLIFDNQPDFPAALAKSQVWYASGASKKNLQQEIKTRWLNIANKLAESDAGTEDAAQHYRQIIEHFSDEDTRQECTQALQTINAKTANRLISLKEYATAMDLLRGKVIESNTKKELESKVLAAWRARAQADLTGDNPDAAVEKCIAIQKYFTDIETTRIYNDANGKICTVNVERFLKTKQYSEALDIIRQPGCKALDSASAAQRRIQEEWSGDLQQKLQQATDAELTGVKNAIGQFKEAFPSSTEALETRLLTREATRDFNVALAKDDFKTAFGLLKAPNSPLKDSRKKLEATAVADVKQKAKKLADDKRKSDAQTLLKKFVEHGLSDAEIVTLLAATAPVSEAKILAELEAGENNLKERPAVALKHFQEAQALAAEGSEQYRIKAIVGQAWASAQLKNWKDVETKLGDLNRNAPPSPSEADRKYIQAQKTALGFLYQDSKKQLEDPAERLAALALLKKDDLDGQLSAWEKADFDKLATETIKDIELPKLPKDKALTAANNILLYRPKDFPTLLFKSEALLQRDKLKESAEALAIAENVKVEATARRADLDSVKVRIWAREKPRTVKFSDANWATIETSIKAKKGWSEEDTKSVGELQKELGNEQYLHLVDEAQKQYSARDFEKCRAALTEAQQKFAVHATAKDQANADSLRLLIDISDDSNPGQRATALKSIPQTIGKHNERLKDLVIVYCQLALEGKGVTLDEAERVLRTAKETHKGGPADLLEAFDTRISEIVAARSNATSLMHKKRLGEIEAGLDKMPTSEQVIGFIKQLNDDRSNAATLSPDERQRYDVALALLTAKLPDKRQEAAKQITELLGRTKLPPPDKLCQAFVALANADDKYFADARTAFEKIENGRHPESVKKIVRRNMGELMTSAVVAEMRRPTVNWSALLRDCAKANDKNPWVQAAKAEGTLEKDGAATLSPADREVAANSVAEALKAKGNHEAVAYAHYVNALVKDSKEDELDGPAIEMLAAFEDDKAAQSFATPARLARAAKVLENAAAKYRQPVDVKAPFAAPFKSDEVGNVHKWLKRAYELTGATPPAGVVVKLGLASWFKDPRDVELVRKLSLPANNAISVDIDKLLFLLIKAQSEPDTPEGQRAAFGTYSELINAIYEFERQKKSDIPSKEKLDRVILPAIAIGTEKLSITTASDQAQRDRLAKLRIAEGRLVGKQIGADPTIPQRLYDTYHSAFELLGEQSKDRAECIVQQDVAKMYLERADPVKHRIDLYKFEQDAKDAEKANPNYAGANYLFGYVRNRKGLRAKENAKELFQEAYDKYTLAIEALEKTGDPFKELPAYYMSRIQAIMKLGKLEVDLKEKKTRYERARSDAQAALDAGPQHPEYAFVYMGNALEELALLSTADAETYYNQAVSAFTEAIKENPRVVMYWLSLARCQYLVVQNQKKKNQKLAKYLDDAESRLQTVLSSNAKFEVPPTANEKTEANYYLALIRAKKNRPADAIKGLREVVDSKDEKFFVHALREGSALALKQAEAIGNLKNDESIQFLAFARECADALAERPGLKPEAAIVRAKAFEIERQPDKALDEYEIALGPAAERKVTAETLPIYLAKHALVFNDRFKVQISGAGKDSAKPDQIVSEAEAVVDAQKDSEGRGVALANAGFAHAELAGEKEASVGAQPEQIIVERTKAVDFFKRAIKSPGSDAKDFWKWRFELARQLDFIREKETDSAKKEALRKEALEATNAALSLAPEDKRGAMRALVKKLEK